MRFYSVRERPELIAPLLSSLEKHWIVCMPWIRKHIERVMQSAGPLPEAVVATIDDKVAGSYTLDVKPILAKNDFGLWVPTLYIDPAFRRQNLSPVFIDHARRLGGKLGFETIHLASEHVNFYEKFGFYNIGPDVCALGDPTQLFENTTILQ